MFCEIDKTHKTLKCYTDLEDLNMPLTDEQRRRIEENKQKAIEKRRNAASKPPQPSNAIPSKTTTSFYGLKDKPSLSKSPFVDMNNRAKISGKCVLATKDRFYIDINYQSEVIELFKQSRTGQYNAKNRNWSFKIEEHDELLRKLRPLQASHNVHVESLPKLILNTMKNFDLTVTPIKNIDLNRIESSLLDVLMPFQVCIFPFFLKLDCHTQHLKIAFFSLEAWCDICFTTWRTDIIGR